MLLSGFIATLTYVLLRGNRFNWFDDEHIVVTATAAAILGVLTYLSMYFRWGKGEYIRGQILVSRHGKAGMLDAAVAGFVILGTNLLVSTYVTGVMHYNHAQLSILELFGFIGMLGGLGVAYYMTSHPMRDPEKIIPFGVLIMLFSCYLLSGSNAHSGYDDLMLPMMIKGLAVGILNISLTVHILRGFPKLRLTEGIAWFYLFRNLGSMLAITQFSRLMSYETNYSLSQLKENYDPSSPAFVHTYQMIQSALQQQGMSATTEQIAQLMAQKLQTASMSVAGINNFQWIIFTIGMLAPVMAVAMKWAGKEKH